MARDEFIKQYKIGLSLNDSDINTINNQLQQLKLDKIISNDAVRENLSKALAENKKRLADIATIKSQIAEVSSLAATKENLELAKQLQALLNDTEKGLSKTGTVGDKLSKSPAAQIKDAVTTLTDELKNKLEKSMTDALTNIADFFKTSFKNAINTVSDMAKYNLSGSFVIDSQAREQAMQYGLSDEQNYAFSRVKQEMGITTDEDMFYMNENQREKFAERMAYFQNKYSEMADSDFLETWQETQIELKELKEEFTMTIAKFIVDNKDIIKKALTTAMNFMEKVANWLASIASYLGHNSRSESEKTAAANDIISKISNVSTTTNNKTLTMSPTYNVTGGDMSKIEEHNRLMYEQLYAAYNNG